MIVFFFFFFQAEDGIRDLTVTGVQTCALPICFTVTLPVVERPEVAEAAPSPVAPATRCARVLVVDDEDQLRKLVDRKSTRLNSSHSQISYAVFCLKKKKIPTKTDEAHKLNPRT